jgi:hypothetical protein
MAMVRRRFLAEARRGWPIQKKAANGNTIARETAPLAACATGAVVETVIVTTESPLPDGTLRRVEGARGQRPVWNN